MRISHDGMDPRSLGTSPVAWLPLAVVSPWASLARLAADFAMRPLAVVEAVPASDAERSALAAFRAELIAEEIGIPNSMSANGGETGVLLRFLRARKLNVSKALAMFRETLEWRAAEDADALMRAPLVLDEFRENAKLYPASYHGRDVHGRPVYIERTGTAKFAEVIRRIGADGFLRMHLRAMEYQARVLLPAASADAGEAVTQMCNVIDVSNLSLYDTVSRSEVLAAVRKIADVDQKHYPENLGVTLVCNAPWSFQAAWAVVRPFLDAKTAAKFVVVGAGASGVAELEKTLGKGRVPAFLGGTCRCEGGCVCMDPEVGETPEVLTKAQVEYAECFLEEEDEKDEKEEEEEEEKDEKVEEKEEEEKDEKVEEEEEEEEEKKVEEEEEERGTPCV